MFLRLPRPTLPFGILSSMTRAYEEIVDFIAAGSSPSDVASFEPSDEARQRVAS